MAKRKAGVTASAIAIASVAVGAVSTSAWGEPDDGRGNAEGIDTSTIAIAKAGLTYPELEAEIGAYRQYHAEEELLVCLREAKSDPEIRGTHMVGPRLKQLKVKQRRYAEFRNDASNLTPEERRQVEIRIVELHLEQTKHIEFARGLFANGRVTTNDALLEYHDTGCIGGLESIASDIRAGRHDGARPAAP